MTSKLVPWPEEMDQDRLHELWQDDLEAYNDALWKFQHARAEAAIARLRVAHEALTAMATQSTEWATKCTANHALALIGDLPSE